MAFLLRIYLSSIERKIKNLERLLLEILKQQRQAEQLKLLSELLGVLQQRPLVDHQQEEWLDSTEVMLLFKISRSTLLRWKNKGWVKPHQLGKRDYYLRRDIVSLLKTK